MADALVEHISAVVLDGGEPLSFRSLGAAAQVDAAASSRALEQFARSHEDQVDALRVSIERSAGGATAADPRARVIRLHAGPPSGTASQVYALYRKQQSEGEHQERIAVACWEQERKARGEIFAQVKKHAPMTSALKVYYASDIACAEATARTEFGDAKGEETVSAFDSINRSKKPSGSSAFFKNTATAASSSTAAPSKSSSAASSSSSSFFGKSSSSTASKTTTSNGTKGSTTTAPSKPEVKRVNAESMSNVLSVDSSDEESDKEETDAPKFVKKSGPASRSKRVISDDDEDMEEVETAPAKRNSKPSGPKRKLQSSKADKDEQGSPKKDEPEEQSPKKPRIINEEDIVIPTKRRVLVNKTRITPEGYMVTEKTYEEHELTPEEIESERQAAIKKQRAAADRAAKASKEKAQAGPRKQKDLRSFFMKK